VRRLNASGSPASHEPLSLPQLRNRLNAIFNCQVSTLRPLPQTAKPAPAFLTYAITATAEPAEFDDPVCISGEVLRLQLQQDEETQTLLQ